MIFLSGKPVINERTGKVTFGAMELKKQVDIFKSKS
ncbi:MAG: hypothetical protein CM15mV103_150 [uncultured marine virus]|nr:MAG: hypothetical protein CM15mV103_150 [uncultured marine virus]